MDIVLVKMIGDIPLSTPTKKIKLKTFANVHATKRTKSVEIKMFNYNTPPIVSWAEFTYLT